MAERTSRRRSFRLRMPRLLSSKSTTTKHPTESKPSAKQGVDEPIQGSSFQHPRGAPSQLHAPSTPKPQPWTESHPTSTTNDPLQLPSKPPSSQKTFHQASSSSHLSQLQPVAQAALSPSSPPSKALPSSSRTASQSESPLRTASQQTLRTISPSPSSSRPTPEEKQKAQAASLPSSSTQEAPPSQPPTKASSHQSTPSQKAPVMLPASQDKRILSQQPSQRPQPLEKTSSKPVYTSQTENQIRATTNLEKATNYPSQSSDKIMVSTPSSREVRETPSLQETSPKAEKEASLEIKREGKPQPSANEEQETVKQLVSMASGLSTKTKEQLDITSQNGKEKLDKAALEGKQTTETVFKDRMSKVVAAYPKERSTGNESRPKSTTFPGGQGILQREISEDVSKSVNKLALGDPNQAIYEKVASVITLAGENRGAAMHVGTESAEREGSVPIHRGYKLNQHDHTETTDEEDSSQRKENQKMGEDKTATSYINSNVQSINNSIILDSSCSERNPGVHQIFSQKPKEPTNLKDNIERIEITPAQKLPQESTVRRRCLRALFLDSSDSDQNKPGKPRRHGCRYSCEKKQDKDKDRDKSIDT